MKTFILGLSGTFVSTLLLRLNSLIPLLVILVKQVNASLVRFQRVLYSVIGTFILKRESVRSVYLPVRKGV